MPLSFITLYDKSVFFSALHLKWNGLYWEEKKQCLEGGKEGIKINNTVSNHRGKSYWQN
jgi:acetoin utilization deacetylase AcuC-like enzyme